MDVITTLKSATRTLLPDPVYRAYRKQHHSWEIRHFKPRITTQQFGPVELTIYLEDRLAEGWYGHGMSEPQEIRALRPWLPGATIFDLGAHQGVIAIMLAHIAGPDGRTIAVEAEPHNANVARRNCLVNRANVEVVPAAVASHPGSVWFTEGLNGMVDASSRTRVGKIEVEAVTIDQLAHRFGAPDVVLIDVEGYEAEALRGASRTLATNATFLVELHPDKLARRGESPHDVVALLRERTVVSADDDEPFRPIVDQPGRFVLASR